MHSKITFICIIMCIMLVLIHMVYAFRQRKMDEEYEFLKSVKVSIPIENMTVFKPKRNIRTYSENKNENYKFIIYHD